MDFFNQRDGRDELCAWLPLPSLSLCPLFSAFSDALENFRTVNWTQGALVLLLLLFPLFIHVYRSLSPTGSSPSLRSLPHPHTQTQKEYYERVRERGLASPSCHTCKRAGALTLKKRINQNVTTTKLTTKQTIFSFFKAPKLQR